MDTAVPSDKEPAYDALGPFLVSDDEADPQASGGSDRLVEPHELVDDLQVAEGHEVLEPPDRLVCSQHCRMRWCARPQTMMQRVRRVRRARSPRMEEDQEV